ncbi:MULTISPECIES: DUF1993 domain-containing protein [unclassified Methylobacterium]|uniref:DUF1993 domain-containing protein n=1 Tax=unclassified Methylobacterium TaxID=2615210 RepID=UPI0007017182|nr:MULTISPECIES: DUF1993 domain-containing protein [unclassified Methylobacterium]KQO49095.1 hypothetical protein ASF24_07830 [Methylobacterium sp. Leaf86]KQP00672.1 hypothetical protein ASF32_02065 [Methylobacterium sp. Leaf91]
MSLTNLLVPTYRNMLRTLAGLLDKAEHQMVDPANGLLSARLAPDMYPLASQVCFAAYQAQEATFRLRGEDIPLSLAAVAAEGRNAGEVPGSMADARARITEALALLDGLPNDALDAGATLPIVIELPGNITFDMSGEQYARDWALPQFYFHVITAYAILRHYGITLGKADYVPHMFAYLRPGSLPSA